MKKILQGIGIASITMLLFIASFQLTIDFTDVISIYIFGAVCGILPIVYEYEQIPSPLASLIHFGGSALTFLIISILNNWIPLQFTSILTSLIIFTIIFFIIWFVFFIINVQQSKKINRKINQ